VGATQFFKGDINRAVDIHPSGTCKLQDDESVVGLGVLPDGVAGKACPWQDPQVGGDQTSDVWLNFLWPAFMVYEGFRALDAKWRIGHLRTREEVR
jgi:hypothetical protein